VGEEQGHSLRYLDEQAEWLRIDRTAVAQGGLGPAAERLWRTQACRLVESLVNHRDSKLSFASFSRCYADRRDTS
jgi:hypothetical protein